MLLAATEVRTCFHRCSGGMREVGRVLVTNRDVGNRGAIGDDIAMEVPIPAQRLLEEHFAGTRRRCIYRVIGAHHATCMRIYDEFAKRRQVGIREIIRRDFGIEGVPFGLGTAMYSEVLRGCDDLQVAAVRSLQASNKGGTELTGQKWVLAIRLLPASPPGITVDVDIWRPEGEAIVDGAIFLALCLVVFSASLGRNGVCHSMDQVGVPGSSETDRLRECCCISRSGDSMQSFVPPVVCGDVQARNGRRIILHL